MEFVTNLGIVALLLSPLYVIYYMQKKGKKVKTGLIANIVCFFAVVVGFTAANIGGVASAADATQAAGLTVGDGIGLIGAALSTGLSGLGGGIAVASSAAAAIGAMSEDSKLFGKALIFVGLAEGIALYGMLVSFQILAKIG